MTDVADTAGMYAASRARRDIAWDYLCDARSAACDLADSYLRGLATRHELRAALDRVESLRVEYQALVGGAP